MDNKVCSAKANYRRNLTQENVDDSKSFWRAMKIILLNDKKPKQYTSSIKVDSNPKTDKNAIAEGFNHFFVLIVKTISEKLSQGSSISCQWQQSPLPSSEAPFRNKTFERSPVRPEVVYNVKKAKKATGLDNIPTRLLKDGAPVISECLTLIIKLSFSYGVMPAGWKTCAVIQVW